MEQPPQAPGIRTVAHRIGIVAASQPACRALVAAGHGGGVRVAAQFASTVSLSASGLLVTASTQPVQLVCQVRVDAASLRLLRRLRVGERVAVDLPARTAPVPMRLEPVPLPLVAFDRPPSWFDRPDAASGALDRLHAAASALATGRDPDAVRRLMGLGIGLTPSGDDALVGMLAAVWAQQGRTAAVDGLATLLDRRPALTTDASLTYLRLACGGEFSSPVLHLVQALRQRTGVHHAVQHVARLGHSSGADLLAGLASAIQALPRDVAHPPHRFRGPGPRGDDTPDSPTPDS